MEPKIGTKLKTHLWNLNPMVAQASIENLLLSSYQESPPTIYLLHSKMVYAASTAS